MEGISCFSCKHLLEVLSCVLEVKNCALCHCRCTKVSWLYLSMRRWHLQAELVQGKPDWGRNWKKGRVTHRLMDSSKLHPHGGHLSKVSHTIPRHVCIRLVNPQQVSP